MNSKKREEKNIFYNVPSERASVLRRRGQHKLIIMSMRWVRFMCGAEEKKYVMINPWMCVCENVN